MAKLVIQATAARIYLTLAPAMPEIMLRGIVEGAPDPGPAAFNWQFSLSYPGFITVPGGTHREARTKTHPAMPPAHGNPVKVPLTTLMCGRLTVTVVAMINGQRLTATRDDILIGGTNPTTVDLQGEVPLRMVRQMIQQESGGKQFSDSAVGAWTERSINPNWSGDNLRGVGLGQLTNPPPGDDDIWNWRANALHLQQRFRAKRASAASLHTRIMASSRFRSEADALNAWRKAESLPPVHARLPALTSDQQDQEGLRAYNGYGRKVEGEYLGYVHEFEPAMTTLTSKSRKTKEGRPLTSPRLLAVDATGMGSWSQVSGAERRRRSGGRAPGDPDYVAHVLAKRG